MGNETKKFWDKKYINPLTVSLFSTTRPRNLCFCLTFSKCVKVCIWMLCNIYSVSYVMLLNVQYMENIILYKSFCVFILFVNQLPQILEIITAKRFVNFRNKRLFGKKSSKWANHFNYLHWCCYVGVRGNSLFFF